MPAPRRCRLATLAPTLAALAAGALPACQSSPTGARAPSEQVAPASAPARFKALLDLAAAELRIPRRRALDAPLPPGLDPADVGPLPPDLSTPGAQALRPLSSVLAELTAEPESTPPAQDADDDRAVRLYVSGRAKLTDGRAQEALADLEAASKLDPESAAIWREIAEAQLQLSRRASAIASMHKAVRLGLREARAYALLGRDALRAGRADEAARLLAIARSLSPAPDLAPVIGVDLAEALRLTGSFAASRDSLEAALAIRPTGIAAGLYRAEAGEIQRRRGELWRRAGDLSCRLGEYERAARAYERAAEFSGIDASLLLARRVHAQMRLGRPAAAALDVVRDIESAEGRVDSTRLALLAYTAQHGDVGSPLADAIRDLRASLGPAAPPSARGGLARAAACVLPDREARAVLRDWLAQSPRDSAALADLMARGRSLSIAERARDLAAIVRSAPSSVDVVSSVFLSYGQGVSGGMTALDSDASPESRLLRAVILIKTGRPEAALAILESRDFPGAFAAPALVALASAASETGDAARLEASVASASRLAQAGDPDARLALALTQSIAGRFAQAREALLPLTAPDAKPGFETLLRAADTCLRADDARTAESLLVRARDADPGDERPYAALLGLYNTGGALPDDAKLAATARALRQAIPASRTMKLVAAEEAAARSLWPQAESNLLSLMEGPIEPTDALSLLVSVWERAAPGLPEMTRRGESWLRGRLADRPESTALTMGLARVLVALGKADEADSLLAARFEACPTTDLARLREWVVREGLDKPEAAEELARARLERSPRTIENTIELAELLASRGRYDDAARVLADRLPADAVLSAEQTSTLLQVLARLTPEAVARAGPDAAAGAVRLWDLVASRRATMTRDMHLARLGLLTAVQPEEAGRLVTAIEDLAAKFPDMRERAYLTVAQTLASRTDSAPILKFLPAAAAAYPPGAKLFLSEWVRLTGARGSVDDARRLVETCPVPKELLVMQQERRTIEIDVPEDETAQRAELAYLIGTDMNSLERTEEAEQVYRLALRLRPGHAWASNNLGYLLLERHGNLNEAEELVSTAYKALPADYHVVDSLAWVRYKRGKIDDVTDQAGNVTEPGALSLLRRAAELAADEQDPTILDHFADALWRAGKHEEAVRNWRLAASSLTDSIDTFAAQVMPQPARPGEAPAKAEDPKFLTVMRAELAQIKAKLAAADEGKPPPVAPFAEP